MQMIIYLCDELGDDPFFEIHTVNISTLHIMSSRVSY